MIGGPCEFCNQAYGDLPACPESVQNRKIKSQALADWQRGKTDAENSIAAKQEDLANGSYMLGREIHKLTVQGLRLNYRQRPVRVPTKPKLRLVPTRVDP